MAMTGVLCPGHTFCGGYDPYPDGEPTTWTFAEFGHGLDFPTGKLHESFLGVVT